MSCPNCGDSEYYFGCMGRNCPNPNCEYPGNKRIQIANTRLNLIVGKDLEDSLHHSGFYAWVTAPKMYGYEKFPLYREGIVVIQILASFWIAGRAEDYQNGSFDIPPYTKGETPNQAYWAFLTKNKL